VLLQRCRRREQLLDELGAVGQRLADGLRALQQEAPRVAALVSLRQLADRLDAGGAGVIEHGA
jgi:hypothetical protein